MILHRWSIVVLAGLLCLPAAMLKAEQISAASPLANPAVEKAAEPGTYGSQALSFDEGVADPFELLSPVSTATVEIAPAASIDAQQSVAAEVNFTPIGIMVASSAVTVVPEPSTLILFGGGTLAVLWAARRRRK